MVGLDQEEMEGKVLEYMRRANWSCHSWGWTIGKARIEGWDDYPFHLEPGENLKTIRHLGWNEFVCNRNRSNPPCNFFGGTHTHNCRWKILHVQFPWNHEATESTLQFSECLRQLAWCNSKSLRPSSLTSKKGRHVIIGKLILVLSALGPLRSKFTFGVKFLGWNWNWVLMIDRIERFV